MLQLTIVLSNETGLHARPAAQFVQRASAFTSVVTVETGGRKANAKSILQILGLGAKQGAEIVITAEGSDEKQCIDALRDVFCEL